MKQITLMFTFVLALGLVSATAQSDAPAKKSCAKTCMGVAKTKDASDADANTMAAATLAAQDASIEKKVCEESGKVSYVRLVTDKDGAVAKQDVRYDADKGEFVAVNSDKKKACCAGADASKQGCCSKGKAAGVDTKSKEKASKKSK